MTLRIDPTTCTRPLSCRSPLLFNQPDPGSLIPIQQSRSKRSRILHPDPLSWPLNQVRGEFLEQQPNEEIMPRSEIKRKTDCKTNFWRLLSPFFLTCNQLKARQEEHNEVVGQNEPPAEFDFWQKRTLVVKFIFTLGLLKQAEESRRMFVAACGMLTVNC